MKVHEIDKKNLQLNPFFFMKTNFIRNRHCRFHLHAFAFPENTSELHLLTLIRINKSKSSNIFTYENFHHIEAKASFESSQHERAHVEVSRKSNKNLNILRKTRSAVPKTTIKKKPFLNHKIKFSFELLKINFSWINIWVILFHNMKIM